MHVRHVSSSFQSHPSCQVQCGVSGSIQLAGGDVHSLYPGTASGLQYGKIAASLLQTSLGTCSEQAGHAVQWQ